MRRPIFQFTLSSLFLFTLFVALCCSLYMVLHPRQYPYIAFQKTYTHDHPYPTGRRINVRFARDHWESYRDSEPVGTLNYVKVNGPGGKRIRHENYRERLVGTSRENKAGHISPEIQERYRRLLACVAEVYDIDALPYNKSFKILLPADYPTFEEFFAEWKKNNPQSDDSNENREKAENNREQLSTVTYLARRNR